MAMLEAEQFVSDVGRGVALFLDVNPAQVYSNGHAASTYNFPFHRRAWGEEVKRALNGQNPPIGLYADNSAVVEAAKQSLESVGLTVVFTFAKGLEAWEAANLPVERVRDITPEELAQKLEEYIIIDIREAYELRSGMIPGAMHIPMGQIQTRLPELEKDKTYAIVCASGGRRSSVASWLSQQGYDVSNVVGGMSLWHGGRHPVAQP
jgi:rhodanese-related sulfurtransferase